MVNEISQGLETDNKLKNTTLPLDNKRAALYDTARSMGLKGKSLHRWVQSELKKERLGVPRIGTPPYHEPIPELK